VLSYRTNVVVTLVEAAGMVPLGIEKSRGKNGAMKSLTLAVKQRHQAVV